MKYIITILSLFLCVCSGYSQLTEPAQMEFKDALRPAQQITIEVPYDHSRVYYEEFMDDRYDVNVKGNGFLSNKEILKSEKIDIPSLHKNTMDLYTKFESLDENRTRVKMIARNGYDLYFSDKNESESFLRMGEMISTFSAYAFEAYNTQLLEEQLEKLEEAQKSQKKMSKQIEKNEKEIAKNMKENEKMREKNSELQKELENTKFQIENVQKEITATKSKLK